MYVIWCNKDDDDDDDDDPEIMRSKDIDESLRSLGLYVDRTSVHFSSERK